MTSPTTPSTPSDPGSSISGSSEEDSGFEPLCWQIPCSPAVCGCGHNEDYDCESSENNDDVSDEDRMTTGYNDEGETGAEPSAMAKRVPVKGIGMARDRSRSPTHGGRHVKLEIEDPTREQIIFFNNLLFKYCCLLLSAFLCCLPPCGCGLLFIYL